MRLPPYQSQERTWEHEFIERVIGGFEGVFGGDIARVFVEDCKQHKKGVRGVPQAKV